MDMNTHLDPNAIPAPIASRSDGAEWRLPNGMIYAYAINGNPVALIDCIMPDGHNLDAVEQFGLALVGAVRYLRAEVERHAQD